MFFFMSEGMPAPVRKALLDSNVLYPAPLRDLLMELGSGRLYLSRWTAEIQREWVEALLRNEPHRKPAALKRTCDLMEKHIYNSLVTGHEDTIKAFDLPDPDDRHVLAAAVAGGCATIVTYNLKHFPEESLAPFGVKARHPDSFLIDFLRLKPGNFCALLRNVRVRLRNPPYSVEEYLETLAKQGLSSTVAELERHRDSL